MKQQNAAIIVSYNPANTNAIGEVPVSTEQAIEQAVSKAHQALEKWQDLGVSGRIQVLRKLCDHIEKNKEKIAQLDTAEIGKPIDSSRTTVDWSLNQFKWQLENAEKNLAPEKTFEN